MRQVERFRRTRHAAFASNRDEGTQGIQSRQSFKHVKKYNILVKFIAIEFGADKPHNFYV